MYMNTPSITPPCSSTRIRSAKSRLLVSAPLGALALAATAEAAVEVFTPGSPSTSDNGGFIFFNPSSSATTETYKGTDLGLRVCGLEFTYNSTNIEFVSLESSHLNLLTAGTTIDSTATFVGGGSDFKSINAYDGSGTSISGDLSNIYVGYRLVNGATTGGYDYGWLNFDYTQTAGTITLHSWALENGGQGFTAGATSAVPEPSSIAMLGGLLVFGFVLFTKRWKSRFRKTACA